MFHYEIDRQSEIDELLADAKAAKGRLRALVNKADTEKRDLTPAETAQVDKLGQQADAALDRAEVLAQEIRDGAPARATQSAGRITTPMPLGNVGQAAAVHIPRTGQFYDLFPGAPRAGRGDVFNDLASFAKAVHQRDPRLFEIRNASGMSTGVAGDGGFYIPSQLLGGAMDAALQRETVRPRALVVPCNSSSIEIPVFKTTARDTGTAGLTGKTTAEGATADTQKAIVASRVMKPVKFVTMVPCTEELLADSPQVFAKLLSQFMAEAISERMDTAFIRGTGVGEPLGILNAPCRVEVAKETSQYPASILPENLAKMVARLSPGSFANTVWIASPSALAQLYTLTKVVRNVANSENVGGAAMPWFSVSGDGSMSLLSRPVVVTDRASQVGTVGDIILADLSQYCIAMRQDATFTSDSSIGYKQGEIWMKVTARVDGQPLLDAPIVPRIGSDSLSPFVSLATRS